eukprot:8117889-Karenia_brevis.AAC.1
MQTASTASHAALESSSARWLGKSHSSKIACRELMVRNKGEIAAERGRLWHTSWTWKANKTPTFPSQW